MRRSKGEKRKMLGRVLIPRPICRLARFLAVAAVLYRLLLVRSLSWEDPLEEGMATLSSILA